MAGEKNKEFAKKTKKRSKLLLLKESFIEKGEYVDLSQEFEISMALTGNEACRMLKEKFDLIVLGIKVARGKGKEIPKGVPFYKTGIPILEKLHGGAFPENTKTPVVVISSTADKKDVKKIKKYADVFLRGPTISGLADTLKKALEGGR